MLCMYTFSKVTKVEILKTTSGSLVDAGAEAGPGSFFKSWEFDCNVTLHAAGEERRWGQSSRCRRDGQGSTWWWFSCGGCAVWAESWTFFYVQMYCSLLFYTWGHVKTIWFKSQPSCASRVKRSQRSEHRTCILCLRCWQQKPHQVVTMRSSPS